MKIQTCYKSEMQQEPMLYHVTSHIQHRFYNTVHILWAVYAINPVSANKCFLKHFNSVSSLLYIMSCSVFTVYRKIYSLFKLFSHILHPDSSFLSLSSSPLSPRSTSFHLPSEKNGIPEILSKHSIKKNTIRPYTYHHIKTEQGHRVGGKGALRVGENSGTAPAPCCVL